MTTLISLPSYIQESRKVSAERQAYILSAILLKNLSLRDPDLLIIPLVDSTSYVDPEVVVPKLTTTTLMTPILQSVGYRVLSPLIAFENAKGGRFSIQTLTTSFLEEDNLFDQRLSKVILFRKSVVSYKKIIKARLKRINYKQRTLDNQIKLLEV